MTSIHPVGILGWTGLVGQTLFHQLLSAGVHSSDIATYNSKNLTEIRGVAFGTLYICCMPAEKWRANLNPAKDRAILDDILKALDTVTAHKVVLISTIDVLQSDCGENEWSQKWAPHAYGQHRRKLEEWVLAKWSTTSILRLPALFGRGLKKNALYDLLHNNNLSVISLDAEFQWYNLARLLRDCNSAMKPTPVNQVFTIDHLVSPPISMRAIVDAWFPEKAEECCGTSPILYNLCNGHVGSLDGPYACTRAVAMREMGDWIAWEKWRMSHSIAASNIGFTMDPDNSRVLHHLGFNSIEAAPARGMEWDTFKVVSVQSLLYTLPITNIFLQAAVVHSHIKKLMESAAAKGIRRFVFGCPRQRDLGETSWDQAVDYFQKLGDLGEEYGVTVCLEPNAKDYGCKWLTNVADTMCFLRAVNHRFVRLSLDTGNYVMEGDTTPLADVPLEWIGHTQVSAAHLATEMNDVERGTAQMIVEHLWSRGYNGAFSWEARESGVSKEAMRGWGQFMNLLERAFHVCKRQN